MRDLEDITLGEIEALPPDQQKIFWCALLNRALDEMESREQAYLQGDYSRTGSYRNTRWGR